LTPRDSVGRRHVAAPARAPWPIAAVVAAAGAGERFGGPKLVAPWGDTTVLGATVAALVAGGLEPVVVVVGAAGAAEAAAARRAGARVVVRPAGEPGDLGPSVARGVRALDEADAEGGAGTAAGGSVASGSTAARALAPGAWALDEGANGEEPPAAPAARSAAAPRRRAAVAIAPGDLPWLDAATVARLLAHWRAAPRGGRAIVAPAQGGRHGHPVVFGPAHRGALAALAGDARPRAVLLAAEAAGDLRVLPVDDEGIWRDVDRPGDLRP